MCCVFFQARAGIRVVRARRWYLRLVAVELLAISVRRLGRRFLRLRFVQHDWEDGEKATKRNRLVKFDVDHGRSCFGLIHRSRVLFCLYAA